MKQIVAATDFSKRSQRAVRRAGALAREIGAALTILHVVDDDQPERLVQLAKSEAHSILTELIHTLPELRDLRCRAEVATGEAFDGILRVAKAMTADMIVMGSHRRQILRDVFIGTTIERVIRTGPYPVLMINSDIKGSYRKIIAGVDLSEISTHAIKTARCLRLVDDGDLTVVHAFIAVAKGTLYVADAPQDQIDDYVARERLDATGRLRSFLNEQELDASHWPYYVAEGSALEVFARAIKEIGADLLIIGTHGRSGVSKIFLGSVAEEALRRLEVDILAVPPAR